MVSKFYSFVLFFVHLILLLKHKRRISSIKCVFITGSDAWSNLLSSWWWWLSFFFSLRLNSATLTTNSYMFEKLLLSLQFWAASFRIKWMKNSIEKCPDYLLFVQIAYLFDIDELMGAVWLCNTLCLHSFIITTIKTWCKIRHKCFRRSPLAESLICLLFNMNQFNQFAISHQSFRALATGTIFPFCKWSMTRFIHSMILRFNGIHLNIWWRTCFC